MHRKLTLALATPLLLVAACATEADDSVAVESGAQAIAALRAAPEAAIAAGTAQFELLFSINDPAQGDLSFEATGAFDAEGQRMAMELDLTSALAGLAPGGEGLPAGLDEPMELIVDGSTTYLRIPFLASLTGVSGWLSASADDLGASGDALGFAPAATDPSQVLESLRGIADDVEPSGEEEVRGVLTTKYLATVDLAAALDQVPEEQRARLDEQLGSLGVDGSMPVEVWLDGDGLVRRMVVDLAEAIPGGGVATMSLELFGYGEPVVIEVPDAADVTPLVDVLGPFGGSFGDGSGG